jgi:type IV fimbrial biogenesis protein FimT
MTQAMAKIDNFSPRGAAHPLSNARGFTLVELMVVLIIVAVLLMVALPSFSVLTYRTKLKSYANEVVTSVYLARSEAIKRNADVTLCVAEKTDLTCKGSGSWEQGWMVIDPNEVIIRRYPALPINLVLLSSVNSLTFEPSGVGSTATSFTLCQQSQAPVVEEKVMTVTLTGRPRIDTTYDGCPGP